MARCQYSDTCPFFNAEVGYSIDLHRAMRETYCLGDNSTCARLLVRAVIPIEAIPDDLMPSENDRVDVVVAAYHARTAENG